MKRRPRWPRTRPSARPSTTSTRRSPAPTPTATARGSPTPSPAGTANAFTMAPGHGRNHYSMGCARFRDHAPSRTMPWGVTDTAQIQPVSLVDANQPPGSCRDRRPRAGRPDGLCDRSGIVEPDGLGPLCLSAGALHRRRSHLDAAREHPRRRRRRKRNIRATVSYIDGGELESLTSAIAGPVANQRCASGRCSSGGAVAYTENYLATPVDPALTVSDIDNAMLAGATVRITGGSRRARTRSGSPWEVSPACGTAPPARSR